jgi:hypothetical protein
MSILRTTQGALITFKLQSLNFGEVQILGSDLVSPVLQQNADGTAIGVFEDVFPQWFNRNVGDGFTDATQAFLDAIAYLSNGGRILVPRGRYPITAELVLNNPGISIVGTGWGSVLVKNSTDFNVIRISSTRCSVGWLEIDGNSKAQGSLILITGSDNTVERCNVHHNGLMADGPYANQSHGIALDGQATTCADNEIISCRVHTNHDIGISQNKATDSRIHDNRVQANGLEAITIDNQAHRSNVRGNRCASNCSRGGAASISTDFVDLCVIEGNILTNTLSAADGIKTNNNLGPSNFNIISDNQVIDGTGWGIRLFAGLLGNASRNTVTSNIVRNTTLGSIRMDAGCDNNKVTGNTTNGVAVSNAGAGNIITASS